MYFSDFTEKIYYGNNYLIIPLGKDAVIFLIDVSSPQMHLKREDDDTELQCALRVVYSTLQKKVLKNLYFC